MSGDNTLFDPNGLFRFSHTGSALLGIGNNHVKARVAMKRIQVGVLINAKVVGWRKSVVNSLAYQRECLISAPLERRQATQTVG